jgi:ABC-type polysaccharide/polyol phosphate transport system ATPase subunit
MIDLKFEGVSKRYRMRRSEISHGGGIFRRLVDRFRPSGEFWALRDVNFQVSRGETLGIIGHNGSGKSTILKLLSSITTPSDGEITVNGRIAALLELTSGFHPELTGRENIFLSGSIAGMKRREIHRKLDRIIDFAEIRPFIDTPVKRYSSGMFVRLGFSIAAHLEPDILLLDEVLAVGDMGFQSKCIARILELKRSGTTIVFISHDLGAVERLCDRVLLLERGRIVGEGSAGEMCLKHLTRLNPQSADPSLSGRKIVEVTSLRMFDENGDPAVQFRTGHAFQIRLEYVAHATVQDATFSVDFHAVDDRVHSALWSGSDGSAATLQPGRGAVEFECDEIVLPPNVYHVDARITGPDLVDLDIQRNCATVHINRGKGVHGHFYMPHRWRAIEETPVERR